MDIFLVVSVLSGVMWGLVSNDEAPAEGALEETVGAGGAVIVAGTASLIVGTLVGLWNGDLLFYALAVPAATVAATIVGLLLAWFMSE